MSVKNYKPGDWVHFQGFAEDGELIASHPDYPHTFVAQVKHIVCGVAYSLDWADGTHVGIPFHDHTLSPGKEPTDKSKKVV